MNQREQSLAVRSHLRAQELARRQARREALRPGVEVGSTRVRHIRESIRAGKYDDEQVLEVALERMLAQG